MEGGYYNSHLGLFSANYKHNIFDMRQVGQQHSRGCFKLPPWKE